MVATKESYKMLDGFKITRTKLNRLKPVLFCLSTSIQAQKGGGKIGYRLDMVRIQSYYFRIPIKSHLVLFQPICKTPSK
jgi:hypothetical protein